MTAKIRKPARTAPLDVEAKVVVLGGASTVLRERHGFLGGIGAALASENGGEKVVHWSGGIISLRAAE